ncbi:Uncharacterised protein [Corynebacterium renale]|uniref:Uncharacterized protein n=1 Tax=Corynebacterium renale TaxID=1724 RepID=A0A2A9DKH3_9CORY|nr:alkaline shock response membrane anchor protein AmaP [Corynebacterium renale]PFG27247.1 hypothetical protein ATK06_0298 [Corynebacterium renale]SQG64020.1 Uncharacterised protein [Corynebacterium renale]SQI23668.1 Uncharacterised protein [Corynebacterium renale]
MSKQLAGWDRFLLILLGLIALAGGVYGALVYFQVPQVMDFNAQFDARHLTDFAATGWMDVALGVVTLLCVILGLAYLISNLRARRFNKRPSSASNEDGSIDIAVARIAAAVSTQLSEFPRVNDTRHKVAMDRHRPTMQWTIKADPTIDIKALRSHLQSVEQDVRAAIGDMDIDTRFILNLGPVES